MRRHGHAARSSSDTCTQTTVQQAQEVFTQTNFPDSEDFFLGDSQIDKCEQATQTKSSFDFLVECAVAPAPRTFDGSLHLGGDVFSTQTPCVMDHGCQTYPACFDFSEACAQTET